jgi:hypothetical protein
MMRHTRRAEIVVRVFGALAVALLFLVLIMVIG